MKVRVRWTETTTYEVIIDTDKPLDELREVSSDGEEVWFGEVDAQHDWAKTGFVEVNDRELDEITEVM